MEELTFCAGDISLGAKEKDSSDPDEANGFLAAVLLAKENLPGRAELLATVQI